MQVELDHIGVSAVDRSLIGEAAAGSKRVYLAPMDKGLSGSAIWQARWLLPDGTQSQLSVFKIGHLAKISKEHKAMKEVAAAVSEMPAFFFYSDPASDRALLHLSFRGSMTEDGKAFSLRNFLGYPLHNASPASVTQLVDRLYQVVMQPWHFSRTVVEQTRSIAEEVPRWKGKIDIKRAATGIGLAALNEDLKRTYDVTVDQLATFVDGVLSQQRVMRWGPIHGDLHAANVNLDHNRNLYLIDYGETRFGWRTLDFVILEAAIKFAATPHHAPVTALLHCEKSIDSIAQQPLSEMLYGAELSNICAAARSIRSNCFQSGAEADLINYRAGLICAAAAFTSIEWLVNRRFLFHSIAYQMSQLQGDATNIH